MPWVYVICLQRVINTIWSLLGDGENWGHCRQLSYKETMCAGQSFCTGRTRFLFKFSSLPISLGHMNVSLISSTPHYSWPQDERHSKPPYTILIKGKRYTSSNKNKKECSELTMLLHTLQKLDNNLGRRTDKDLPLSALFSVGDCL